jgi:hypothetical protein
VSSLPTIRELQDAYTKEVFLGLQNPVKAHALQIVQLSQQGDGKNSDNDNETEHKHQRDTLKSLDDLPADNEPQDIERLRPYVVKALFYVLSYFVERKVRYYTWNYRHGHFYLDDGVETEPQTILKDLQAILSQVEPCFQKIYDEIESILHFVPDEFLELLEQTERDIVSDIEANCAAFSPENIPKFEGSTETLQNEDEIEPSDTLWGHITISRDQTRSSDFEKLKLLILRSRRYEVTSRLEDAPPSWILLTTPTAEPPPPPPPPPSIRVKIYALKPSQSSVPTPYPIPVSVLPRPISPNLRTRVSSVGTMEHRAVSSTRVAQTTSLGSLPDPAKHVRLTYGNDLIDQAPMDDLLGRISLLEIENRGLKSGQGFGDEIQVIYCIVRGPERTSTYLDEPTWIIGPRGEAVPKAHFPIPDVEGYLRQKHGMAFSVQKNYQPGDQEAEVRKAVRDKKKLPKLRHTTENIRLESQDMRETFKAFVNSNPLLEKEFSNFNPSLAIDAPYLFWYHHRSTATTDGLSEPQRLLLSRLTTWIDENYGKLYDRVEKQLARGVVSYDSMPFLVNLGDAIVVKHELSQQNQELSGVIAESYLTSTTPRRLANHTESRYSEQSLSKETKKKQYWNWVGHTWSYKFDGSFYESQETIDVKMVADDLEEEISIQDLNAFPIRYASKETAALLEHRGREFWKCRKKRLVAYHDKSGIYGVWFPHA